MAWLFGPRDARLLVTGTQDQRAYPKEGGIIIDDIQVTFLSPIPVPVLHRRRTSAFFFCGITVNNAVT